MKICVVSLFTKEIEDVVSYTSPNQKKYCELHGYDYRLFKGRLSNRFPAWDKVLAVKKVLLEYDYVLWMDSDCIFNDFNYKLEDLISLGYLGYFGKDPSNDIYVNTGVFLLKNDKWSFELLDYTWKRNGQIFETVDKYSYSDWPFEQGPMCDFLKSDIGNHYIVPNYILNSHPLFINNNTIIIHYMGCRTNEKTYVETIDKMKLINQKHNIENVITDFIEVVSEENKKQDIIIYENKVKVIYKEIVADLTIKISKNKILCYEYSLPQNTHLSHIFKINNDFYNLNSDKNGCIEVPDNFELYHSYDWFGEKDFKFIGDVSIN